MHYMTRGFTSQLRRGVLEPCILALLSREPRYGLQLVTELDQRGALLSSQGTIYPLLGRLHDAGSVTSYWERGESERPRRYYEITESGRAELERFRAEWGHFLAAVNQVLEIAPPSREEA